jgi:hypothetical protein
MATCLRCEIASLLVRGLPMTQDEELDRLERYLHLFVSRPMREKRRRKSRITAAKFEAYMTALADYDTANEALAAKPDDAELMENVRIVGELLNRMREELRH